MPTYEYQCRTCGTIEVFQRMSDDPLTACPECGADGLRRLISGGAGVIFKGDGFWETDYNRGEDYKKSADRESGKTATDGAGADGGKSSGAAGAGDPPAKPAAKSPDTPAGGSTDKPSGGAGSTPKGGG